MVTVGAYNNSLDPRCFCILRCPVFNGGYCTYTLYDNLILTPMLGN